MAAESLRSDGEARKIYLPVPGGAKSLLTPNASIPSRHASEVRYVVGTTSSSRYTAGRSTDTIDLPAVSAAIYRVQ